MDQSATPGHPPQLKRIVYVDVDDTLVRTVGTKRIPIPKVIEQVRSLHASGADLYCWSTGGAIYARHIATELGIADCFTAFLPKPHLMIDDLPVAEWRTCTQLHPANC